jgi:hypothetical protein
MRATVLSAIALMACLSQAHAAPRSKYQRVCGWQNACVYTNQTTGKLEMCVFLWWPLDKFGDPLHCYCKHRGGQPPGSGFATFNMFFEC